MSRKRVLPDHLIIIATHQHSGPDAIGLWGPDETTSGVDPEYIKWVGHQSLDTLADTKKQIQPTKIPLAMTSIGQAARISTNHQEPNLIDRDLGLIKVDRPDGTNIGLSVNFTMCPEVMRPDSRLLTADFPSVIYRQCDVKLGEVTLFINGALGGMISPDRTEDTFAQVEQIGSFLVEKILNGVETAILQNMLD